MKVRSFSAGGEIADVFDAVISWIKQPGAQELVQQWQKVIEEDEE